MENPNDGYENSLPSKNLVGRVEVARGEGPVVLTVFFETHKKKHLHTEYGPSRCFHCAPNLDTTELFGGHLWKREGRSVFIWSIEMVVAGTDQRWVVFGPFPSPKEAKEAFHQVSEQSLLIVAGYRIEHEVDCDHRLREEWGGHYNTGRLPCDMWTDG